MPSIETPTQEPPSIPPVDDITADLIAAEMAAEGGAIAFPLSQITLARYVERIREHPEVPFSLDPWQHELCRLLEQAFWCSTARKFEDKFKVIDHGIGKPYVKAPNGFHIDKEVWEQKENFGTLAAIHAPPQFGKSNIISIAYPAWIMGYDPLHRFRLATYNIYHSAKFSKAIQQIMRSPEHKMMFPDPKGHLPVRTKFVEWTTNARVDLHDAQPSFIALGLETGFVGTGADTLVQDDPYASPEQARSEKIRDTTWRFQTDTAKPRLREYSNNFVMFHRYHTDDQGGRAIASGDFDLWRFAAQADGVFEDDESGHKFPCLPLDREEGAYLSDRFPDWYYESQKKNLDIWNAQFQGRPTSKGGTFFDITKITRVTVAEFEAMTMLYEMRAWDNAATEGSGDYTAGARVSIDSLGNCYLRNMKREQFNTGERTVLQSATAKEDGKMVPIHYPQDPASAGKDMAFTFKQKFEPKGYTVVVEPVTGKKTERAHDFSELVNLGKFFVVDDDGSERYLTPAQVKAFLSELRDFPFVGVYDDQVDATADAVNYLLSLFHKGRVIKVNGDQNILGWSPFVSRFGDRVPGHWEVALACRIAANPSIPSGWALIARAAENAKLGETVFVVASQKMFVADPSLVFDAMKKALRLYCTNADEQVQAMWIKQGSAPVIELAAEKYDFHLQEFAGDDEAGLPETAWYFSPLKTVNPFYDATNPLDVERRGSRCYIMTADSQINKATDEFGQLSLRQDVLHWAFNSEGKPQPFGGIVLDCVRMTLYNFWLTATALTLKEKRHAQLPQNLQTEEIQKKRGTPEFRELYWAQQHELDLIRQREQDLEDAEPQGRFARPVKHERYHRPKKND